MIRRQARTSPATVSGYFSIGSYDGDPLIPSARRQEMKMDKGHTDFSFAKGRTLSWLRKSTIEDDASCLSSAAVCLGSMVRSGACEGIPRGVTLFMNCRIRRTQTSMSSLLNLPLTRAWLTRDPRINEGPGISRSRPALMASAVE